MSKHIKKQREESERNSFSKLLARRGNIALLSYPVLGIYTIEMVVENSGETLFVEDDKSVAESKFAALAG
jgi:hypothetical protein